MSARTPARRRRVTMSPEDRREAILQAGTEVFSTTGFAKATMAEVARAGGIAQGTIYLYFESKEHLLAAVWERYVEGILEIADRVLAGDGPRWSTLDELWAALLDHAVRNAELHRTVYGSANAKALELCKDINRRVIDRIGDYVAEGVPDGTFAPDAPTAFRIVYHGVDGLLDELIATGAELDVADLTKRTQDLTRRTLSPRP
ncbi:TetR/AcrR family transcriptional regulator [Saccharopolyspora shandongensis]|uniref:TetR/AcrR family transcriptional regulator n=1 Tax=Saccharopolyspora shandongensis TaxID=418495 RepID=UPI0033D86D82